MPQPNSSLIRCEVRTIRHFLLSVLIVILLCCPSQGLAQTNIVFYKREGRCELIVHKLTNFQEVLVFKKSNAIRWQYNLKVGQEFFDTVLVQRETPHG
jgi:hypothetical protein